jgi:hypothetical protein
MFYEQYCRVASNDATLAGLDQDLEFLATPVNLQIYSSPSAPQARSHFEEFMNEIYTT